MVLNRGQAKPGLRLNISGVSSRCFIVKLFKASVILSSLGILFPPVWAQEGPGSLEKAATEVLQRKVAEREKQVEQKASTNAIPLAATMSFAEVEKLFLEGAITARQFQFYVGHAKPNQPPLKAPSNGVVHQQAIQVLRKANPDPKLNPKPGPAIHAEQIPLLNPTEPEAENSFEKGFSEIEAKMDELLRRKLERERATNTVDVSIKEQGPATPKTKRQRLDDLLRLYIAGKISEAEYNEGRGKIIAEPE